MSRTIDYDDWLANFKPQINQFDGNASFDGMMFETYGAELEYVSRQEPNRIWTIIDSDESDVPLVINGFHQVNRIGYLITAVPSPDGEHITVVD